MTLIYTDQKSLIEVICECVPSALHPCEGCLFSKATSAAEADLFNTIYRRPKGLLHPVPVSIF